MNWNNGTQVFNVYLCTGVYAAAFDLEIEWAIIKGISGYADGTKSKTESWQTFSSVMAASVVYNIFKEPGILEGWRHYEAYKS